MLLSHGHAHQLVAHHGDDGGLARLRGRQDLGDREYRVRLVGAATLIPDGDGLVEVVLVKIAQAPWGHAGQRYLPPRRRPSPEWVIRAGNKTSHHRVERIRLNFGGLMAEANHRCRCCSVTRPDRAARNGGADRARRRRTRRGRRRPGQRVRQAADRPAAGGPLPVLRRARVDRAGRPHRRRLAPPRWCAASAARTSAPAPPGPGAALWVEVTEVAETEPTDEIKALAAEYKKLLLAMLQRREAWQIIDFVNKLTDPSALADTAGYASYLTDVQKRQLLETADVAERLRVLIDWTSDHLAEVEVNDKIAEDVREGMEKTAEGVPAAPAAGRDPQGTGRGRARRVRRLPGPRRGRRPAREGARGRAARGRQAGTLQRAEPGGRLDPHLAGHRARPAVERHAPRTRPT